MEPLRRIEGGVSVIDRADVDTDQIVPKQFLKRVERSGFGRHLFHDWRRHDPGFKLEPNPILVTGRNFGCGSSREHAPWALEDFGFKAIVAPSFADIFATNCTKIGLLPVVLPEPEVRALMEAGEAGERAAVDLERQVAAFAGREIPFELDPDTRNRLLQGLDDIALTLAREDEIERYERGRERSGPVTTAL